MLAASEKMKIKERSDVMTMINLDGVRVVYEGVHRIRWVHAPGWGKLQEGKHLSRLSCTVVGHVWPEMAIQATLRRQIEHGQRTVVVVDGRAPIVELHGDRLPSIPVGAELVEAVKEGHKAIFIPPFTWLSPGSRRRGEAFVSRVSTVEGRPAGQLRTHQFVEEELIGTGEPLRFVYSERALYVSELRQLIRKLYDQPVPAAIPLVRRRTTPVSAWPPLDEREAA